MEDGCFIWISALALPEEVHWVQRGEFWCDKDGCPPKQVRNSPTEMPQFHLYTSKKEKDVVGSKLISHPLVQRDIGYRMFTSTLSWEWMAWKVIISDTETQQGGNNNNYYGSSYHYQRGISVAMWSLTLRVMPVWTTAAHSPSQLGKGSHTSRNLGLQPGKRCCTGITGSPAMRGWDARNHQELEDRGRRHVTDTQTIITIAVPIAEINYYYCLIVLPFSY